jgi:hypothetical protein
LKQTKPLVKSYPIVNISYSIEGCRQGETGAPDLVDFSVLSAMLVRAVWGNNLGDVTYSFSRTASDAYELFLRMTFRTHSFH